MVGYSVTHQAGSTDWAYTWPAHALALSLASVHETGRGVEAELTISSTEAAAPHLAGPLAVNLTGDRYRVSRVLTDSGLDEEEARAVVETAYKRTVDAYRQGQPVVDLSDVRPPEPPRYLLSGFLPLGQTTIMSGDGGTGKSTLAVAAALSVVCCQALVPRWRLAASPGNVLYLDWETSQSELARIISGLCRGHDLTPPAGSLCYLPMSRPLVADITRIREEVSAHDAALVIVDSLGPAAGDEPESNQSATRLMNALRSLGSDVTKLCIGHVSKWGAQQKGRMRTFGGVYLENLARAVWEVRRAGALAEAQDSGDEDLGRDADPDDAGDAPLPNVPIRMGLYHRKHNGPPQRSFALRLDYDALGAPSRFSMDTLRVGDELGGALPLGQRLLLALGEHPKTPVFRLAELCDDTPEKVRVALSRLGEQVISLEEDWRDQQTGRRARSVWALRARS